MYGRWPERDIETEKSVGDANSHHDPGHFTEVVRKSMTYILSDHDCEFPFLAMSRSGSQETSLELSPPVG
jgi:hypothetical protein